MTFVITAREANSLLDEIDRVSDATYNPNVSDIDSLLSGAENLKMFLGSGEAFPQSTESLRRSLIELREKVKNCERVQISVSFGPTAGFEQKLKTWVLNNLKDDLVIEIKTDPDVVSGLTLTYKGIYKDYSLNSLLNSYFEEYSHASDLPR
jgi:hypothetical protein